MEEGSKPTNAPATSAVSLSGTLPRTFRIADFAKARAEELLYFKNVISGNSGSKRTFQTLPRHLRRRTMSHNPWKIPRRIRHIARKEMEGAEKKKKKRTLRRHKRRPRYALQDYARRQRKFKWLETHIWHAKRMHMIDIWGWKIANFPNDKGVKAMFRSARNGCTIHDMSYYHCIEVSGKQSSIFGVFKEISYCGSVANQMYLNGCREGHSLLYHFNQYPLGCIGPISFLWNPEFNHSDKDPHRQLWIFAHPSIGESVFTLLSSQQNVTVTNVSNSLIRFRLVGPTSHEVMKTALKIPANIQNNKKMSGHQLWTKFLESVNNVASLPPGIVINLPIQDPVEVFPPTKVATILKKKSEPYLNVTNGNILYDDVSKIPPTVAYSPLWKADYRAVLTSERKFPNEVSKPPKSAKKPKVSFAGPKQTLNVLMIQHPGADNLSLGSGWDIIAPAGWAMPLWMNFVYAGARPVGQRDICHLDYELGLPFFPIDFPDTASGAEFAKVMSESRQLEYQKKPPGKRSNFRKLRTKFPFGPNWKELLESNETNSVTSTGFCVLRGDLLDEYCNILFPEDSAMASSSQLKWVPKTQNNFLERFKGSRVFSVLKNSLVQVTITLLHGGNCPHNSMLCLPVLEDYQKHKQQGEKWSLQEPIFAPKIEKKLQKNNLISDVCTFYDEIYSRQQPIRLVAGYLTSGMTPAGYSYIRGQSFGIGFMSSEKLAQLFHEAKKAQSEPFILVRSPSSPHYVLARISL